MEKIKYFTLLNTIVIIKVELIIKFMLMVKNSKDLDLVIAIHSQPALIANYIQGI